MTPEVFLEGLVRQASPTYKEQSAVAWAIEQTRGMNFDEVKRDEAGSYVAVRGNGPRIVLLLGHIDTVPGEIPVRVEHGVLYGRGTVDAKGCLASMIYAVDALTQEELGDKTYVVVGAVEEECLTSKGARHVLKTVKPDFLINGEPSGLDRLTIGYKGGFRFRYVIEKENTHFASKETRSAEDALEFLVAVRQYLLEVPCEKETDFFRPRLEMRSINTDFTGLKDRVEVCANVRIPPGFDHADFESFLKDRAQEGELKITEFLPGVISEKNTSLVRAFLSVMRSEGLSPSFVYKTGSSDMNTTQEYFPHIPKLAYGPGDASLDHTSNEHIDLAELSVAIRVLSKVLKAL